MILLELFSGIGGFAKGFEEAGMVFRKHYFSEVDTHAIANYKYNFKNAEYVGSVKHVRSIVRIINESRRKGERLVITFGSPCQDFSLAGRGAGLKGSKSSLITFAIFLIKWLRPDVYIWENVKGAYSTNDGADYWAIIQAFGNIPGYGLEQQLVNTAWFIPQNRERIYIVGHIAEGGRSWPGVFPFGEELSGINERPAEATNVRTLTGGGAQRRDAQFNDVTACVNDRGTIRDLEGDKTTCLDNNYHKGTDNHGQRTMIRYGENK